MSLGAVRRRSHPAAETAATALRGTRRTLLAALAEPDSAAGLARRLGLPRQRLNYHLKALETVRAARMRRRTPEGQLHRAHPARDRAVVRHQPRRARSVRPTPEAAQDRFSASYVVAVAARTITEVSTLDARARADRGASPRSPSTRRSASRLPNRGRPLPRNSPIASPRSSRSTTTTRHPAAAGFAW